MKRLTQPSSEPVSLSDVKAQLSISDSLQDDIITRRIVEARQWAEEYMQRTVMPSTWLLMLDKFPNEIELRYPPIISVTSVQYIDNDGVLQTLNSSLYSVDTYNEPGWILPAYGSDWPSTRDTANAVRVEYTAGYASVADVPGPIKEAITLLVGHWMNYQRQIESGEITAPTRIPLAVEQLLSHYKIWKA